MNELENTPLIDSHCHLQTLTPDEREEALDSARARGVRGFLVPGTRLDESEGILELCHTHPDVWCALGVHPHDAESWRPGDAERLAALLEDPRAVAVGECGLDFFYDNAPRAVQIAVAREQFELACSLDLPVVVHNRSSDAELLALVREPALEELEGDFHSFAGELQTARELIERGFYLGVTGMVTFKKADNIREIVELIPRDRLLVETDTPYLAPVPYRGKPNRPAYVVEVAQRVAEELGVELAEVFSQTTENFYRLFAKAREWSGSRTLSDPRSRCSRPARGP